LETGWECAAPYKLFFQSRGQLISLGKSWRKIAPVFVIPSVYSFTVIILIVFALVIISVLTVSLSVPVPVTFGQREIACEH